ncbi:sensor histidine kinase [Chromohalobacter sp. HP20-39]|uniref:sensor histidine kinase n=1 Tax=Chromohalobacter sp. HP20-39 TaxID=3079306 RepID=UPI00294B1A03|nr:histidine kinase dimerization/phospho-acceptor domain-containing protein [Chromohalobacter sp. HP20-39]MDV6319743.1 histidine kinase dimerization/phospho-acceptor domain-containing protein [Chromohalobacter sp. HP20-39]
MASTLFLHRIALMATQVSRRWRPRSLLQLVLLAFVMVMLPIAVLMFQAGQALSELSSLADVSARQAVEQTRRARTLSNLALEMERSARQYAVLEQEGLLSIYNEKSKRYAELLDTLAPLLPDNPDIPRLREQLHQLNELTQLPADEFHARLAIFRDFSERTENVRQAINTLIDARIENIRERASTVRTQLWMQTAALVSVSLGLMLIFTWLIIRPIRQLERRIFSLGSGMEPASPQHIQGPAELVRLGERLTWLSGRLTELEAQKQQFLRHMSHELKTPLASVREGTALLSDGVVGELSERQREIVGLIDVSGQELQALIEQLLDYNLMQHSRGLKVTRFDLVTVIQEVLTKHRLALDKKGMHVDWPRHTPLPWRADRERTARILDNLISNAIAYGEDGGYLALRALQHASWLVVEVANTGEPIDDSDRARLFEAFYQGRMRRQGALKGSGIGLSVAADCARVQNGRLELVEDDTFPVCFRLTLPEVTPPEEGADGDDASITTPATTTPALNARNSNA